MKRIYALYCSTVFFELRTLSHIINRFGSFISLFRLYTYVCFILLEHLNILWIDSYIFHVASHFLQCWTFCQLACFGSIYRHFELVYIYIYVTPYSHIFNVSGADANKNLWKKSVLMIQCEEFKIQISNFFVALVSWKFMSIFEKNRFSFRLYWVVNLYYLCVNEIAFICFQSKTILYNLISWHIWNRFEEKCIWLRCFSTATWKEIKIYWHEWADDITGIPGWFKNMQVTTSWATFLKNTQYILEYTIQNKLQNQKYILKLRISLPASIKVNFYLNSQNTDKQVELHSVAHEITKKADAVNRKNVKTYKLRK